MQPSAVAVEQILQQLAETPQRLTTMTAGIENSHLYDKLGEEEWSVNEILAHLRVCAEVWGKSILTRIDQEQPSLRYVSPRTIAKKRNYPTQEYQTSLQEFSQQRADLVQALHALEQSAWARGATFTGTTRGREQTIYSYARRIVDHEAAHLDQIARIMNIIQTQ